MCLFIESLQRSTHPSGRVQRQPDLTVEISLRPWDAFQPDGVIIFSDTPLPAFGVPLDIEEVGVRTAVLDFAIAKYITFQVDAGARCIQIFESWGGQLPPDMRERWSKPYFDEGPPKRAYVVATGKRGGGGCRMCRAKGPHPQSEPWVLVGSPEEAVAQRYKKLEVRYTRLTVTWLEHPIWWLET
ncbi:Uroporphyrinogen decarboxylase 1 [Abeliophyllum distichum]|uniref:Uroporphyrinogen decarboxylase 1 n=1 Tax=Abeliophyllum distichum TaxID=126358 RepID=A0ABD1QJN8_9LAMI